MNIFAVVVFALIVLFYVVIVCSLIVIVYVLWTSLKFYLARRESDSALQRGDSSENDSREDTEDERN